MSLEIAAGSLAMASPSVVSRRTREQAETENSKGSCWVLAGLDEQTSSEENIWTKINQFRLEQNDGKA